jgi:apolipoprotein N-acyltransferase
MNWLDVLIVVVLGLVAAFFFGLAAWLYFTPPKPDGCWLKPRGFHHRK